ncbi:PWWP domain-containing DNA repair factor 3B-like isoform X2 [Leuresthes tenuis]|uniref:PWWP domain-containing DNA repair factor 3B-like isoform X2 n=1 Tax=Leuresthes tenuis TaxID=355514 RepID=UPI003B510F2C
MKGRPHKTRKREPKKRPTEAVITDFDSAPAAEESNVASGALSTCCQSPLNSLTSTPKRGNRHTRQTKRASLTSTPVHNLSDVAGSPPDVNEVQLQYTELIARSKTPAADSSCSNSNSQRKGRRRHAPQPRQVQQSAAEEQTQTNGSAPKRKRGRPRKTDTVDLKGKTSTQSSKHSRPLFEQKEPDAVGQDSWLSSDLSIELSHHKEPSLPFQEDEKSEEEEEEEEDLPSFLMQMDKKPPCITEGAFVWCKYRYYPSWPALVKSVNRKQKKASILFIEDTSIQKKKGFTVALKTLKPFDCEEDSELILKAKEMYDAAITWSLELIEDYRIRIACGSFSGTFIEYFNHDMSYPVRKKYPQAASERLTISSDDIKEDSLDETKEDDLSEKNEDVCRSSKRLLPDRTHAAHNRANEKLVHFIVKQRMVERHLLAVIRGEQQSRWLRSFLSAKRRRVVNIYLEDDQQLDQVYWYLSELYATTVGTAPCLAEMKSLECVPFVLDVLLPEAIIYAIAGVDNVSVKKAEEKYLKGRCISNRERQEFDLMIERQMRRKSQRQNAALDLFSDPIS